MNSHFTVAYVPLPPERTADWARAMELLTEIIIEAVEKENHKPSAGLVWRTKTMAKNLKKRELEELVHSLAWNARFVCYTRPGLEQLVWNDIAGSAQFVIFIDVDDMHALNEKHGYEGVNEIIKKSLSILRASDYIAGQWFSGDEFAVFVTHDPERDNSNPIELCQRLHASFHANGASATFGIARVSSTDLNQTIKPAFELVQNAKKAGRRGSINTVEGEQK